jgi:hypothetical protein
VHDQGFLARDGLPIDHAATNHLAGDSKAQARRGLSANALERNCRPLT